jgi:lipoprotein-anchoring transpeptidase ErfK/SrfK
MIDRRTMLLGGLASLAVPDVAAAQWGHAIDPVHLPRTLAFSGYEPGTVIVDTRHRFLYYMTGWRTARRYGIGVGRAGLAWSGSAVIGRKAEWPRWTPTANMIRREPHKYARWAGGMSGGPRNPLGARALYLYSGGRDTMYRIHGTNEPGTIGRAVSSGCIRMVNAHVEELYRLVPVGTRVVVR